MKASTKLARMFNRIGDVERNIESIAGELFAVIKSAKVTAPKQWDALVREAYAQNGWNTRPGRPASGSAKGVVPSTVRTYVAVVRAALRKRMKLGKYRTFTALRAALARKTSGQDHRSARGPRLPKDLAESFRGVPILKHNETNGALFHDLGATYIHLPKGERDLFGRQLNQLLAKYAPLARGLKHPTPALPAPKLEAANGNGKHEERKAA